MVGGERAASIYPLGLGALKTPLFSADSLERQCRREVP